MTIEAYVRYKGREHLLGKTDPTTMPLSVPDHKKSPEFVLARCKDDDSGGELFITTDQNVVLKNANVRVFDRSALDKVADIAENGEYSRVMTNKSGKRMKVVFKHKKL